MTISEFVNKLGLEGCLFRLDNELKENAHFSDLLENELNLDFTFLIQYENIIMRVTFENKELSVYERLLYGFYVIHMNELNHMYDALFADYNPISNYDKNSTITNIKDKVTEHNAYGERNTTDTFGSRKNTDTNQISAYDTTEFSNSSKDISESDTATDTHKTTTVSDDKVISGTYEDGKIQDVMNEHTSGNIGITTSQQMIESEMLLREKYSFYKVLFDLWLDFFTINIYETEV